LITSSIVLFSLTICTTLPFYFTKFDKSKIERYENTLIDTVDYSFVDILPSFEYIGLSRTINPAKQIKNGKLLLLRDSLLSVYLEDNIKCPNFCEGIFQYYIKLKIDEKGNINEVSFTDNNYNSSILEDLITGALKKIHFKPAIKDKKNVSLIITVNVFIDLYNYPSKIRKSLFKDSVSNT